MPAVTIVSFGFLHGDPPPAHLVVDLRQHFRDPHVSPELRYMTALDEPVRQAVLGTPASPARRGGRRGGGRVHCGPQRRAGDCGRRVCGRPAQGPVFAQALADQLIAAGHTVTVQHRDLHRPVVNR